jgi:hypothetical protein
MPAPVFKAMQDHFVHDSMRRGFIPILRSRLP